MYNGNCLIRKRLSEKSISKKQYCDPDEMICMYIMKFNMKKYYSSFSFVMNVFHCI